LGERILCDTANRNKKAIKAHIANQLQENQIADQMNLKKYIGSFTGSKKTRALRRTP